MTHFTVSGDMYIPTISTENMLKELPAGTYTVVETMAGPLLQRSKDFDAPPKLYGNVQTRADRILKTALDRANDETNPRSTGVLLAGAKGSGKTQLARVVSTTALSAGIPTIIVNAPFHGNQFNALIAAIDQPAIVLFDEFEKVYSEEGIQEQVLTLLDGVTNTQKLFILTVNNVWKVDDNMKNRPGRLFYHLTFGGLETDFVREYCEDVLNDKSAIDDILKVSALFKEFNFDMLKAIVEEVNRYNESVYEVLDMLNAKPFSTTDAATFEVVCTLPNGVRSKTAELGDLPMAQRNNTTGLYLEFERPDDDVAAKGYDVDLQVSSEDDPEHERATRHCVLRSKDLTKIDAEQGHYVFVDEDGWVFEVKKKAATVYDMRGY